MTATGQAPDDDGNRYKTVSTMITAIPSDGLIMAPTKATR